MGHELARLFAAAGKRLPAYQMLFYPLQLHDQLAKQPLAQLKTDLFNPIQSSQQEDRMPFENPSMVTVASSIESIGIVTGNPQPTFQLVALESFPLKDDTSKVDSRAFDSRESKAESSVFDTVDVFPVTLNQVIFASLNGHPVINAELASIQKTRADYLTATLFPSARSSVKSV